MEATKQLLDLNSVIEDMFMVLTDKEKEVIVRRYSLNNKSRETLEKIGKSFSVTRERIRQIENGAIKKLRRTIDNTKLSLVTKLAKDILQKNDGLMRESDLISEILKTTTGSEIDGNIIKLALNIDEDILPVKKSNTSHQGWRLDIVNEKTVRETIDKAIKFLAKKTDVIDVEIISTEIQNRLSSKESLTFIKAALKLSKELKETQKGYGLMAWRHINPKSIRDKALIVMRDNGKPMHFIDVANRIAQYGFDKKVVTTQAVHNELIRDKNFVLVGRGLYALREWGYQDGTVEDVITDILKNNGAPMKKSEIVKEVLKRRDVKMGTIALNLQKNPNFVRVGRAVYEYKES